MDKNLLMEKLQELPLYFCDFIDPKALEFAGRIRWICENDLMAKSEEELKSVLMKVKVKV